MPRELKSTDFRDTGPRFFDDCNDEQMWAGAAENCQEIFRSEATCPPDEL